MNFCSKCSGRGTVPHPMGDHPEDRIGCSACWGTGATNSYKIAITALIEQMERQADIYMADDETKGEALGLTEAVKMVLEMKIRLKDGEC